VGGKKKQNRGEVIAQKGGTISQEECLDQGGERKGWKKRRGRKREVCGGGGVEKIG